MKFGMNQLNLMIESLNVFGNMINVSHSIFALPFALTGALLASKTYDVELEQVVWIIIAMVFARSAAMGFNRLVDRRIDARNPRTKNRALPTQKITPHAVITIVMICCLMVVFAAYQLNPLCFALSPIALIIILSYSYFKRFTWLTHLVLGLAIGIAPMGAWIAISGTFDVGLLWLTIAILTWVAGFDIIYACQDYSFDVAHGVHSIPSKLGIGKALMIARLLHVVTILGFLAVYHVFNLNNLYLLGTVMIVGVLIYEHKLVTVNDLSKIEFAFFNTNGLISVIYFIFSLGDVLWLS
tara:strand:- start:98772 stop:99662 length:891 start_codon:yes stop_codon:yes gene_type:complete